jgi:tRNA(Arg) A34 adenosine deaminase TadA
MVGMMEMDEYWCAAFTLAWEAFQERSIPVGAVLVDGSGTVIGQGRNRMNGTTAPPGQIAGSRIAHAEINALAQLPSEVHEGHILYTTLEPCFLCTMALRFSHVGTVRYAAPDATWYGIEKLQQVNHHVARRWTRRDGPSGGWLQEFSLLLNHISAIETRACMRRSTNFCLIFSYDDTTPVLAPVVRGGGRCSRQSHYGPIWMPTERSPMVDVKRRLMHAVLNVSNGDREHRKWF